MQSVRIRITFNDVAAKLKFAPVLKLLELRMVRMITTEIAIAIGERGIIFPAYVPSAMAQMAIGAANPIVIEINPERKPKAGWNILERKTYSPPDLGILAASSP